jgi:hypothetical protein
MKLRYLLSCILGTAALGLLGFLLIETPLSAAVVKDSRGMKVTKPVFVTFPDVEWEKKPSGNSARADYATTCAVEALQLQVDLACRTLDRMKTDGNRPSHIHGLQAQINYLSRDIEQIRAQLERLESR